MNCTLTDFRPHIYKAPNEADTHKALLHSNIHCRQRFLAQLGIVLAGMKRGNAHLRYNGIMHNGLVFKCDTSSGATDTARIRVLKALLLSQLKA